MNLVSPLLGCPQCHGPMALAAGEQCDKCGFELKRTSGGVAYDYLSLLRKAFPRRYPLYRALCNNGFVSYQELAAGSLSLPERKDVAEFGSFLGREAATRGVVLDLGCGPLPVPGYLVAHERDGATLVGLDVYPTGFRGFQITGCAEFLPLMDGSVDLVVFATSLDHVCDLGSSFEEVRRVLRTGGRCVIWMSDRRPYWKEFIFPKAKRGGVFRRLLVDLPKQIGANLRDSRRPLYGVTHYFTRGRYWVYDNGSVFYCPPGAIDPFHSYFESADEIAALATKHGFKVAAREEGSNGVFLALERA